eukprot:scaffold4813_cov77-Phaeocystis_antarctica.AAC.3
MAHVSGHCSNDGALGWRSKFGDKADCTLVPQTGETHFLFRGINTTNINTDERLKDIDLHGHGRITPSVSMQHRGQSRRASREFRRALVGGGLDGRAARHKEGRRERWCCGRGPDGREAVGHRVGRAARDEVEEGVARLAQHLELWVGGDGALGWREQVWPQRYSTCHKPGKQHKHRRTLERHKPSHGHWRITRLRAVCVTVKRSAG